MPEGDTIHRTANRLAAALAGALLGRSTQRWWISVAIVVAVASWAWLLGFYLEHRTSRPSQAEVRPRVAQEMPDAGGGDAGPAAPHGPRGALAAEQPSIAATRVLAADVAPED